MVILKSHGFKIIEESFEQDTSSKAIQWAKKNVSYSTEIFCKIIDENLWEETLFEMKILKRDASQILSEIDVDLGGGGYYYLLYFLIRKIKWNSCRNWSCSWLE